jgi:Amt family ammonium transporter
MNEYLWLVISALLVFLMQAGFLCLETGRTRSKNNINVAAKNIIDFILSSSLFWLVGFGFMFGQSVSGMFGTSDFLFGEKNTSFELSFFIFQMMFCGTAATLTSGAVAERMSFVGYIFVTSILSTVIYPIVGHWTWSGLYQADNKGWLESLGFVDFAGATVVHSVGGWVALAAIIIIGPRLGRFTLGHSFPSGSNLPMAALGVFLIWFGWFGFNGGSALVFNDQVPRILLNTCLSAIWGGLAVTLLNYYYNKYLDLGGSLNGIIAGLVGITAACHAVSPAESALIGIVSGAVMYYTTLWMEKKQLDDALGVVPAHLMAGIWGTLAVAFFADPKILANGLTFTQQLQAQVLGIVIIGFYSFCVSYILLRVVNQFIPLRVSIKNEKLGLNISEHRASTELIDLLNDMGSQQLKGDFTTVVKEEPFTEVGQIARKYNQVIKKVADEMYERDQALEQFQTSEKRKSAILDSSMDSIISINNQGHIIEFNHAAERLLGSLKKHVRGLSFIDLFIVEQHRDEIRKSLQHAFSNVSGLVLNRRTTMELLRISGGSFPAEITITNTKLGDKFKAEFTFLIRDVAKEIKLQSRLRFLAYKDPLTGLSNRTHMMKELNILIKMSKQRNLDVALYFLDLDKFKKINDTLGHKAGDDLLCEVASRLKSISRDNDVIARWGGDEFIFIIMGSLDENLIFSKANSILDQMRNPIEIKNNKYQIPTSIGVAVSNNGSVDADTLIQHADIAMYQAKENGRDNYQFYTPDMGEQASRVLNYELEIKNGLHNDEFYLVYQPKVTGVSALIVGLEALIRWDHPTKTAIFPADFIPVAEQSHLIIEIGEFVVKECLAQIMKFKHQGIKPVPVSVNISERHLLSDGFYTFIKNQLSLFDVAGSLLEIEITEGVLIKDIESCITVLSDIKSLGITISIDDFGTGYSSMNYLKRLPIDILKIDRSFVTECSHIKEDREICAAIINLSAGMNLKTIAEGVENIDQVNTLIGLGCDIFQGYYFYKPVAIEEIGGMLNDTAKDAMLV